MGAKQGNPIRARALLVLCVALPGKIPTRLSKDMKRSFQVLPEHSEGLEKHPTPAGKAREELWLSSCSGSAPPGNGHSTDPRPKDGTLVPSDSCFFK